MEQPESPNAFKGNPKFGIKTGVQRPKPLKRSTSLQFQSKQAVLEPGVTETCENKPRISSNEPEGK